MQRTQRLQAAGKAFARHMHKVTVDGESRRDFELRERRCRFFQPQIAALCDGYRATHHLGRVFEHAVHLLGALHEELRAFEFHAPCVAN